MGGNQDFNQRPMLSCPGNEITYVGDRCSIVTCAACCAIAGTSVTADGDVASAGGRLDVGAVLNTFTRAPTTLAMTAASLARVAEGRATIVLGGISGHRDLARDTGIEFNEPKSREGWGQLAHKLGVKGIHIAERDTQRAKNPKPMNVFVNTWSVEGFVSEGLQPAELGWGTHEKGLPHDGARHEFGCDAAIYLNRPGLVTRVRTWTPLEGPFHGFIITHNEAISLADYFTLHDRNKVVYRPTVHYAYHPCDQAIMSMHEIAGKNLKQQKRQRLIVDEIESGRDELGVLLAGHRKNAYWYGSQLSIDEARAVQDKWRQVLEGGATQAGNR